jgi:hypothetical protein
MICSSLELRSKAANRWVFFCGTIRPGCLLIFHPLTDMRHCERMKTLSHVSGVAYIHPCPVKPLV